MVIIIHQNDVAYNALQLIYLRLMDFSKLRALKPIEWMLAGLLVLAPLYFHPNIGGTGLRIPNNIVIWLVASVIGFYSLYKLTISQYIYLPRYYIYILSFPILAWCSGMFAGIEIVSQWFFRLLFIWSGLLFLFGLFQFNLKQDRLDRLLFILLFSGFFHGLVGLAQIILVDKIPAWLPFNASGMPTGLFQHINNQASFQVTIIILGLWLVSRPFIRHAHAWRFISLVLIISLSAFIVGYSGSRVGALGFLLAFPLLLISRWRFVKADKHRWILILIALVVAITTANTIENKRGLTSVLEKTTAINSGFSSTARLGIYDISVDLIKQKPLFGHGIGSFVRVWQYEKPNFYQQHPEATLPTQRVSHPHNETLFWLVEGGLISGLGLLLLLIGAILSLAKLPHSRRYAYAAFLLPIAIHTQVELPFYISAQHWFIFLFLLAITLWPTKKQFHLKLSMAMTKSIQIIALLAVFTSIAFLAHSYAVSNEFKDHLLKKTSVAPSFTRAQENPYFKSLALDLMMVRLFEGSVRYGMVDNVQIIADWAEEEVIYNPHILYFKLGTQSYLFLKQNKNACTLATKGNTIYPSDEALIRIVKQCDS
jgi:O-antigen polymerase